MKKKLYGLTSIILSALVVSLTGCGSADDYLTCKLEHKCDERPLERPGKDGETGPRGEPGAKGESGVPGPEGSRGEPGSPGAEGPAGAAGEPGPAGAMGPGGMSGPAGEQGLPGAGGIPGQQGPSGPAGTDGNDGAAGTNISTALLEIADIDHTALPWTSNNYITAPADGAAILPNTITVNALPSTGNPQNGWFDLKIGNKTYCYRRVKNKKDYLLTYKKTSTATLGCDSDSEKDSSAWTLSPLFQAGDSISVIPRDTKLSVPWTLQLTAFVEQ